MDVISDRIVRLRSTLSVSFETIHFTPVEKTILTLLSDGEKHKIDDVLRCLHDGQASRHNIAVHVYNIRSKIKHLNHTILCVSEGKRIFYQYVLLLEVLLDS